jgi:hypothetical protein
MHPAALSCRLCTCALFTLTVALTSPLVQAAPGVNPIATAVQAGDCKAAIDLVNKAALDKDAHGVFLGGRMQDEGGCVDVNREAASHYFEAAATLGDAQSMIEFAGNVGLGIGTSPNYERAGALCRSAGMDKNGKFTDYALGYVCTARAEAGHYARLGLSPGDIAAAGATAHVQFRAADGSVRVLSAPHILSREEASTGSRIRRPRVNVDDLVEDAVRKAVSHMPKADTARLGTDAVDLVLDLDMSVRINPGDAEGPGGYLNDPRIQTRNGSATMTSGKAPAGN